MTQAFMCPDVQHLGRFDLGPLPEERIEELAVHLHGCSACLQRLQALTGRDSLTDTLLAAMSTASSPLVQQLIARLKALAVPAPALEVTESPVVGELSLSSAQPVEVASILAAPQQSDEIGRLGAYRVLKQLGHGGMGSSSWPRTRTCNARSPSRPCCRTTRRAPSPTRPASVSCARRSWRRA